VTRQDQADSRLAQDRMSQAGPLKLAVKNPRIIVRKSARKLELYSDSVLLKSYKVGLGLNPVADKEQEGDRCTPEGEFYIFTKNNKSAYYLSLGLSYPNDEDADRGLREGLITKAEYSAIHAAIRKRAMPPQNTKLGGQIYIHGHGAGSDWTWGCVALENEDLRELYDAVSAGTPVSIVP
jgi:murein L,D-transpeptidase YafK